MTSMPSSSLHALCQVSTLDQLTLLLFLHSRPCRGYTADYLAHKLGRAPGDALTFLVHAGLVVRTGADEQVFSYGVEEPRLLAAVAELSGRSRAASALIGFVAALVRRRRGDDARVGLGEWVAKPRQLGIAPSAPCPEPAQGKRRRRLTMPSLAGVMRASGG